MVDFPREGLALESELSEGVKCLIERVENDLVVDVIELQNENLLLLLLRAHLVVDGRIFLQQFLLELCVQVRVQDRLVLEQRVSGAVQNRLALRDVADVQKLQHLHRRRAKWDVQVRVELAQIMVCFVRTAER